MSARKRLDVRRPLPAAGHPEGPIARAMRPSPRRIGALHLRYSLRSLPRLPTVRIRAVPGPFERPRIPIQPPAGCRPGRTYREPLVPVVPSTFRVSRRPYPRPYSVSLPTILAPYGHTRRQSMGTFVRPRRMMRPPASGWLTGQWLPPRRGKVCGLPGLTRENRRPYGKRAAVWSAQHP